MNGIEGTQFFVQVNIGDAHLFPRPYLLAVKSVKSVLRFNDTPYCELCTGGGDYHQAGKIAGNTIPILLDLTFCTV